MNRAFTSADFWPIAGPTNRFPPRRWATVEPNSFWESIPAQRPWSTFWPAAGRKVSQTEAASLAATLRAGV